MTQDQFMMTVRILLQIAGTYLCTHGIETEATWAVYSGALIALAPIIWSFYARRQAGLKSSVANIPGTLVVETPPAVPGATYPIADHVKMVALANQIAAIPEVSQVTTTPDVAASSGRKVLSL